MAYGKLILIDGNSLANRAYYALPRLTSASGQVTNAVYGFTTMLFRLIEEEKPDMMAVAFDRPAPTFRHAEYEGYKATRTGTPEDLRSQIPLIKDLLHAMRIRTLEVEGFEADDILGTVARMAEERGVKVFIVTGDRDALQLVSENTTVMLTKKGISDIVRYDDREVCEALGIRPEQIMDLKGLMGDQSDNIPGVKGIGEKTALKLLKRFGTVEKILENIDAVEDARARSALSAGAESALMSKRLATIVRDVPITVDLEECRLRSPEFDRVARVLEELDFRSLVRRLASLRETLSAAEPDSCGAEVVEEAASRATAKPPVEPYCLALTQEEVNEAVAGARKASQVVIMCDHGPVSHARAPVRGLFLRSPGGNYYVPIEGGPHPLESMRPLRELLQDQNVAKAGHALKACVVDLLRRGVDVQGIAFDASVAAYLLDPSRKGYSLGTLAKEHLGVELGEAPEDEGSRVDHFARCAWVIENLWQRMRARLQETGVDRLFREVEMPLLTVLAAMECEGVGVDLDTARMMAREFSARIEGVTKEIYGLAGCEFNVNSTRQLAEVLFEKLKLPATKKTKTGYSTSEEVLESLAQSHEIAAKILEYRQLAKLKGTYLDGVFQLVDPETGRLHTTFHQTVTETGRISSAEPNLQNIPIRQELGRMIRRIFVPRQGRVLLAGDYSQIELRVLAHFSEDPTLIEAFLRDEDIHRRTAAEVFGVPVEEVTDSMRSRAKAVNFGIVYGISDFGLSKNIGVSRGEAKAFIDRYLGRYPGIARYMERTVAEARRDGFVTTLLKRRRYLPDINSPNRNLRMFAERTAINTPIQGSAADIIKMAMVGVFDELRRRGMSSAMILQVHDELVLEVPEDELKEAAELLKRNMERAAALRVPLKADLKVGANWYDMKNMVP